MDKRVTSGQAEDQAAILAEQFDEQLKRIIENVDDRLVFHLKPINRRLGKLERDVMTVKAVLKDTNKDIKSLDTAMGYAEHKIHNLSLLVTDNYLETATKDRRLLQDLDKRVGRLEEASKHD